MPEGSRDLEHPTFQRGARSQDRGHLQIRNNRMRRWLRHLARLVPRALVATFVLWLVVVLPLPPINAGFLLAVRVPLAIFLFIVYIGVLLYDTFFYDRYQS